MDYTITLLKSETVARDTMAFFFSKPNDFSYQAGQSIDIMLSPANMDGIGDTRSCTVASSPYEDHLMIAMRIRNTVFKHTLKNLTVGTEVPITGPYGSFVLEKGQTSPVVFLTGGIGITPAYSMIRQALRENCKQQLILIDSNHKPEDAPFLDKLTDMAKTHVNFTYIPTMTQADEKWKGKRKRIDETLLKSAVTDLAKPTYYTCGSISMVYYLRQLLKNLGVSPENIRSEDFPGY